MTLPKSIDPAVLAAWPMKWTHDGKDWVLRPAPPCDIPYLLNRVVKEQTK